MKKFYLKATGSTCYDKNGITFPTVHGIDLTHLIHAQGIGATIWRKFPFSNCPKVLSFFASDEQKNLINKQLSKRNLPLICLEMD